MRECQHFRNGCAAYPELYPWRNPKYDKRIWCQCYKPIEK